VFVTADVVIQAQVQATLSKESVFLVFPSCEILVISELSLISSSTSSVTVHSQVSSTIWVSSKSQFSSTTSSVQTSSTI